MITTVPSGASSIDTLLAGHKWESTNVTIAFPQTPAQVGYSVDAGSFSSLDATTQTAFKAILARWTAVTGVTFTEVSDGSQADISVYYYTGSSNPVQAYGLDAGEPQAGDIQLTGALNPGHLALPGSSGYFQILQAIGVSLGLRAPAVSGDLYVSESVMSLYSHAGHVSGSYPIAEGSYPSAPMLNDVAAIQYLYGPNNNALTSNLGDTTYTFDPSAAVIFQTRVDGGGVDTFNFSSYATNLSVDLRPGGWTDLGGQYASLDTGDAAARPPGNIAVYADPEAAAYDDRERLWRLGQRHPDRQRGR